MARYAELMYVENQSGKNALKTAVQDVAAGALAYDTIPCRAPVASALLARVSVDDHGKRRHDLPHAALGDGRQGFLDTLKDALSQYAGKAIRTSEFEKIAEADSRQPLTAFFAQWVDGTARRGSRTNTRFTAGQQQGFRTIGEIEQDLDLFRMRLR